MLLVPQVFQSNPRDAIFVWSNTHVTFTLRDVSLACDSRCMTRLLDTAGTTIAL